MIENFVEENYLSFPMIFVQIFCFLLYIVYLFTRSGTLLFDTFILIFKELDQKTKDPLV